MLLGDRLYGSDLRFAALAARGVDMVTRLNGSRGWPKGMRGDDVTVQWMRPAPSSRPPHVTQPEWEALPATIAVRYVRYRIEIPGIRIRHIRVVTTLLDAPAKVLAQLYMRRWEIELSIDDIKTTMGMDFIRARSPAMAVKMGTMYAKAYNLIRLLRQQAARATGCQYLRGALDAPVFQGRAGRYLALRRRNFASQLQAMAQPATSNCCARSTGRLPAQASRSLRTQGYQTTTQYRFPE